MNRYEYRHKCARCKQERRWVGMVLGTSGWCIPWEEKVLCWGCANTLGRLVKRGPRNFTIIRRST